MQPVQAKPDGVQVGLNDCLPKWAQDPGWCADVLLKCDALKPLHPDVSAAVALDLLHNNEWSEAADMILAGLGYGYPTAWAFATLLSTYAKHAVGLAQTTHRLDDCVQSQVAVAVHALALQAIHFR